MSALEFPALLQTYFSDHLLRRRAASPHTIRAYSTTFRLLLRYASERLNRAPSKLTIADLDATLLSDFLDHLEHQRGNSPRSRNARLAAIHSFYRHVALSDPRHLHHCQRIQAIPSKRHHHTNIEYLTEHETEALLASPDPTTWHGRRDRALLLTAIQTGLRVSELISLQRQHLTLNNGAHVRCYGKGRKLRATPLRRDVARILKAWLHERPPAPDTPIFPNHRGGHLSSDAVERLVTKHATAAHTRCPSLKHKHVTPHTLRHSAAMALLQRGVDRTVIALWLGHESPETTQIYLHADLQTRERALARTTPTGLTPERYHPDDALLTYLENL